jgi:hypothetical protein
VVERDLVEAVAAPRDGRGVEAPIPRAKRLDAVAQPILHVGLRRANEFRRHDVALAVVELDVYGAVAAHLDDFDDFARHSRHSSQGVVGQKSSAGGV